MAPQVDSTTSKLLSGERQVLGVGLLEGGVQAIGLGALAGPLQQGGDVVDAGGQGEAAGGGQGGVAVAAGHVQDPLPGPQVDGVAQELGDREQSGADGAVVAGGPGGLLALLDGGDVHGTSRWWRPAVVGSAAGNPRSRPWVGDREETPRSQVRHPYLFRDP
jgi:hypothetical protein